MPKKLTLEKFIEKAKLVHSNLYDYTKSIFINIRIPLLITCIRCGKTFKQSPMSHLSGSGCSICNNKIQGVKRRKTTENFIERAKKIHGDKYDYSKVDYQKMKIKVNIFCKVCKRHFYQAPHSHLTGNGCPYCARISGANKHRITTEHFIEKAKLIHGDKYDYSETQYISADDPIKVFCKTCKKYFWQNASGHLQGRGCRKCGYETVKLKTTMTLKDFIRKAKEVHKDKFDYSLITKIKSGVKVKVKCNKCGNIFEQSIPSHLQGKGCPRCANSKGEEKIEKFLINKNIIYIRQYRFKDCKNKRCLKFDFYLPIYNLCIEYQGAQHYEVVKSWGGEEGLKIRQLRDQIKRDYCKQNGIYLLEIRYDEDIEEKLKNFFETYKK